jgi:hypothetical protein
VVAAAAAAAGVEVTAVVVGRVDSGKKELQVAGVLGNSWSH